MEPVALPFCIMGGPEHLSVSIVGAESLLDARWDVLGSKCIGCFNVRPPRIRVNLTE